MAVVVNSFDVFMINLDPTVGSEIKKTRPCLIISPDEMNRFIRTLIVAPMTTAGKDYPSRIQCEFKGKKGQVVLDQIRPIDKSRLIKKIGTVAPQVQAEVISTLQSMFYVLRSADLDMAAWFGVRPQPRRCAQNSSSIS